MSTKLKTTDLTLIAMFVAIIAICSWIAVPATVPFTMQTFGVFLTIGYLGGRRGTFAILSYLLLGLVGAPVFAGFTGGPGHLMTNTGGYILGFLFSALTMWGIQQLVGCKHWGLLFSMALGLIVCYLFGTIWFMILYAANTGAIGFGTAVTMCVLPYLLPDAVKIGCAYALTKKLHFLRRP